MVAELKPGLRIADRFELVEFKGQGGFGSVWKGFDHKLAREVAIKRFHSESFFDSAQRVSEAEEEARKIAAIRSPYVVAVYDVLQYGGELLIVMEYMDGGTLHDHLRAFTRSGQWIDAPASFGIVEDVLHGLEAAHSAANGPIIHRDLKPQNLLFDAIGHIKIADFGLAAIGSVSAIKTSHPGKWEHSGTWGYKSPEQLRGDNLDARTDLFNLGLIAFLVFGACHPYVCPRYLFDYKEMVLSPYRSLPPVADGVLPKAIEKFVSTLLAERPEDRYSTASEALVEFEAVETEYDKGMFDRALELYDSLKTGVAPKPILTSGELSRGIMLCRKNGFYAQGAFLYEKSGIDLTTLAAAATRKLEQDYQFCRRHAGKEVVPE